MQAAMRRKIIHSSLLDNGDDMHIKSYDQFARLNKSMVALLDSLGVKRAATIPFIDGDSDANHITAVGAAAAQHGGLTKVLVTSYHNKAGRDHGDGESVLHSGDRLESTILPAKSEEAATVLSNAQKLINQFAEHVGKDSKEVQTAQGYLDLFKKSDGAGMNALDFAIGVQQIILPLAVASSRKLKVDRLTEEKQSAPVTAPLQPMQAAPETAAPDVNAPQGQ